MACGSELGRKCLRIGHDASLEGQKNFRQQRQAHEESPNPPTGDLVIPHHTVASHQIAKRSLMPEGLTDGYSDDQVRDLFTCLLSLQ